jgi:hypothetical protein
MHDSILKENITYASKRRKISIFFYIRNGKVVQTLFQFGKFTPDIGECSFCNEKNNSRKNIEFCSIKVSPANEMELLGVKFDNNFTTSPHDTSVAKSARQRATLIARLAHHLPRGEYLRQLTKGLFIGKISFALAAVVAPRLGSGGAPPSAAYKSVQVAINGVARSITGIKRTGHVKIPSLLHHNFNKFGTF